MCDALHSRLYKALYGYCCRMKYSPLGSKISGNDSGRVIPNRNNMNYLCWFPFGWVLFVGLVHLLMGLVVLMLYWLEDSHMFSLNQLRYPVTQMVVLHKTEGSVPYSWRGSDLGDGATLKQGCSLMETWNVSSGKTFTKPLVLSYGTLDVRILLMVVFFASAVFLLSDCTDRDSFYHPLEKGRSHLSHFVEASFTFPLAVLIICSMLGVTDLMTLLGAACNAWCCMVFSQLAEILSDFDGGVEYHRFSVFRYNTVAHFAHWIAFVSAVSVFFSNVTVRGVCVQSGRNDNQYIVAMLAACLMVIMFALFGLVQSYVLNARSRAPIDGESESVLMRDIMCRRAVFNAEFAYAILNLITKTLLAFLVYVGSFV